MQPISIGFGKATFKSASIVLTGFCVTAPFDRKLASKILPKSGRTLRMPTSSTPDINGWLYQDTVDAPDGTLLLLQMQEKYRGSGIRDGAILIMARREGALMNITAKIPSAPESALISNSFTVLAGRGDILTPDDAKGLGIVLPKSYAKAFMDAEEVAECYAINVVQKAAVAAPRVEVCTTSSGEEVKILTPIRQRRMRIHRE